MDNGEKEGLTVEQQIANDLAALWKEYKDVILVQVAVIDQASRAASNRELTEELRQKARREAHKLAGSVGSFGFEQGSLLASRIESILKSDEEINEGLALQLAESVEALRRELDKSQG